jgi:hypothetical protein
MQARSSLGPMERRMSEVLIVSGVPTVLVDGIRLFSGAIPPDLMEAELRKACCCRSLAANVD